MERMVIIPGSRYRCAILPGRRAVFLLACLKPSIFCSRAHILKKLEEAKSIVISAGSERSHLYRKIGLWVSPL